MSVDARVVVALDEALSAVAGAAEQAYLQGLADAAFDEYAATTPAERALAWRLEAERLGSELLAEMLTRQTIEER